MDKISIVVAVYNAERTLRKCVDSLLNQTYTNIEIILVNDCSQDNSLCICDEYATNHENIKVINNPENQGVSSTRNNGIDASIGRYICFVDSDDYVEQDYLEQLHYYAEKYNTVPICGFVYHDEYNHRKPVNYKWSGGNELVGLGDAFKLNDELYLTALWNKLFDNDLVKSLNVRFDKTVSIGEDLRFSVEYLQKTNADSVFAFSDTLYHYTKLTDQSLMADFARQGIEVGIDNLKVIRALAIRFNEKADHIFDNKIEVLKKNMIYFIIRDRKYSKQEKIKQIQEFSPEFTKNDYRSEKMKWLKERIMSFIKR